MRWDAEVSAAATTVFRALLRDAVELLSLERREELPPYAWVGFGAESLHSEQLRMAALTVSLMRTQWYFSAMLAVVLLMPP